MTNISQSFPLYYISNFGSVIRIKTNRTIKIQTDKAGYKYVQLYKNKKRYNYFVHRLVAECYLLPSEKHMEVNHIDGNKSNNHYSNLEWVTPSQNVKHSIKLGLRKTKINNLDVSYIRNNYIKRHKEFGIRALARKLKVSPAQISNIVKGYSR